MDYSQYQNVLHPDSRQTYPQSTPTYSDPYAQQQYQTNPPHIRNPFAPPPAARVTYSGANSTFDPEYEAQVAQWQAAYAPQDPLDKNKKVKSEKGENPNFVPVGTREESAQAAAGNVDAKSGEDKKMTVVRKGGGKTWEDQTLLEWDPSHFRIQVGNLAGEITDDSLAKAFAQYGVSKARVIRDKTTTKSKGYGFVAFTDGEMGFKAAREMVGKYIGSHPVTIQRAKTDVRPVAQKDKGRGKIHKNQKNRDRQGGRQIDLLRANTGTHIEKKPVRNPAGYKMLG